MVANEVGPYYTGHTVDEESPWAGLEVGSI